MTRSLLLSGVLLALCRLFTLAHPGSDPLPAPELTLAPGAAAPSCKPEAPVRVELSPQALVGGRARVDYELTPVMDVLDLRVEIVLPQGGWIRWHNRASEGPATRGTTRSGSLSVELPVQRPGVEVEVRAMISIPDPDAAGGVGVYTTTRTAVWGDVQRTVTGVTEVTSDGELTLDTAATRH